MKRFFSVLFACVMLLSSISFADIKEDSAQILVKLKLMSGYEDGTLRLENNITRAEFCTLIIKAVGNPTNNKAAEKEFSDMKPTHWAYNTVKLSAQLGFINGYEDGTFRPSNNITYAECCAILVGVLGYQDTMEGTWPNNVINKAVDLGLTKDLDSLESSHKMTRGEVSVMLVNSLYVESKNQYTYNYARKD